jgi:hypothetical protein
VSSLNGRARCHGRFDLGSRSGDGYAGVLSWAAGCAFLAWLPGSCERETSAIAASRWGSSFLARPGMLVPI